MSEDWIEKTRKNSQLCESDINQIQNALAKIYKFENHFFNCSKWSLRNCKFEKIRKLEGHQKMLYSVKFLKNSPDKLISISNDKTIKYWNAFDNKLINSFELRTQWLICCDISRTSNHICIGDLEKSFCVYKFDQESGDIKLATELNGHDQYVKTVSFTEEQEILSGSGDCTLALWDLVHGVQKTIYTQHMEPITCADDMKPKNIFVSGASDSFVKLWDFRIKDPVHNFSASESEITSLKFFPDGNSFASASDDSTIRLFDIRTYLQLNYYHDNSITSPPNSVSFSKTGNYLYSVYDNGDFVIWDLVSGILKQRCHNEKRLSCVDVNRDGNAVATGSWDNNIYIWTNDCFKITGTSIVDPKTLINK